MSSPTPTREDLAALLAAHAAAMAVLARVTWPDGYPRYPEEISRFMTSLSEPPWRPADPCDHNLLKAALADPGSADLLPLRAALCDLSRSERFAPGSWHGYLESGVVGRLLTRVRALLSEIDAAD